MYKIVSIASLESLLTNEGVKGEINHDSTKGVIEVAGTLAQVNKATRVIKAATEWDRGDFLIKEALEDGSGFRCVLVYDYAIFREYERAEDAERAKRANAHAEAKAQAAKAEALRVARIKWNNRGIIARAFDWISGNPAPANDES